MKSLLCLVFFAGFATLATAQQDESKPSKEETIKWINEKLKKYTITDEENFEKMDNATAGHIINYLTPDALTRISITSPPIDAPADYQPVRMDSEGQLSFYYYEWSLFITASTYKTIDVIISPCDIKNVTVITLFGVDFLLINANNSTFHFHVDQICPIIRKGWGDDVTYDVDFKTNNVKKEYTKDGSSYHSIEEEYRQFALIPFDVNREPDLVKRLNDAFQHLKTFCEAKPKEAF